MATTVDRSGTYKANGELAWSSTSATTASVDCVKIGSGSLVSITRKLPTWTNNRKMAVTFKMAIVGPASGSLTGCDFFAGFCTSHAKRFGQNPAQCFGAFNSSSRSYSMSGTTYLYTIPGGENYQWSQSLWSRQWNGVSSTGSGGGFSVPTARANITFSDGINATHGGNPWTAVTVCANRDEGGAGVWRVHYFWDVIGNWNTPRNAYRNLGHWGSTIAWREQVSWMSKLVGTSNTYTWTYGQDTVDEGTNGTYDYFNLAWQNTGAQSSYLLVRDFQVHAGDWNWPMV